MQPETFSAKYVKQRKLFAMIPILSLPFIIILFVALGGGKYISSPIQDSNTSGINLKLPDAHFRKADQKNKLSLYEDASKDSLKLREQIKNDPYYTLKFHAADSSKSKNSQLESILQSSANKYGQVELGNLKPTVGRNVTDPNEERLNQKLEQLKKIISSNTTNQSASVNRLANSDLNFNHKVYENQEENKIAGMLQMVLNKNSEPDSDLIRLNGMLDKILLIQHPQIESDSLRKAQEKKQISPSNDQIKKAKSTSELNSGRNVFFELAKDSSEQNHSSNSIDAVIDETKTIVAGSIVRMRLLDDIIISGFKIPKNQIIYGTASLNNERAKISISSIAVDHSIVPVHLQVYDLDGIEGVSVPGSLMRDVSKQSASDGLGSIGVASLDPSIGAQAASAGIQAAKSLMTKKVRLVRITLNENYKVYLKQSNSN